MMNFTQFLKALDQVVCDLFARRKRGGKGKNNRKMVAYFVDE